MTYNNSEQAVGQGRQILARVFAFMAAAVALSGFTAVAVAQNPEILTRSPWIFPFLMIAQLATVIALSWGISSMSYMTAQLLFIVYSVLTGATLSVIFQVYQLGSIVQIFFIAAAMFGGMAVYGMYTKTDLSRYRSILLMTLFGLIIALLVNIFLRSSMVDMISAGIGVLLFSALTAFDIQNIQRLTASLLVRDEDWQKIALIGALQLYLDFINLFLSLLRLFGKQKN